MDIMEYIKIYHSPIKKPQLLIIKDGDVEIREVEVFELLYHRESESLYFHYPHYPVPYKE